MCMYCNGGKRLGIELELMCLKYIVRVETQFMVLETGGGYGKK